VKPALFYVLLGAKMPAILVESSYLTNASDEGRLRDEACLQRIAEGIFLGIRRFAVGSALAAVSGR
jgi:N-acetylmuramoyl-L-alanine amidase